MQFNAGRARPGQGGGDGAVARRWRRPAPLAGVVPAAARIPDRRRRSPTRSASAPQTVTRVVSSSLLRDDRHAAEGRPFVPDDRHRTSPPVVILSESMAQLLLQEQRVAIGRRISWKLTNGITVVSDAAGGDRRRRRRLARRRDRPDADAHDVSAGHADRRADRRCSCARPASTGPSRAARRRDHPQRSIRTGRSITCRRSRRFATRRSRRSG